MNGMMWVPTPSELAHLWQHEDTADALASGQVAEVYRVLQRYGVSQRTIARIAGHTQSEVSEILAGRTTRDIIVLARIADGLCLSRRVFGLAALDEPPVPPPAYTGCPVPLRLGPRMPKGPALCSLCRAEADALLPAPGAPVIRLQNGPPRNLTPVFWTGVESRMLRLCRRMTVSEFGKHLGISGRAVSKWEQDGKTVRPLAANQEALDTSLRLAAPAVRARFEAWLTQYQNER